MNSPARPNSKISPKPTTNGGVMMGNMARMLSGLASAFASRSAQSAIKVPRNVVPVAVSSARPSVFQATPQRPWPLMHPSPQMRAVPIRSQRAPMEKSPSSLSTLPIKDLRTGYTTNSASKAVQHNTAPATNASPLNPPRRATPMESSASRLTINTMAPHPMPGWV